MARGKFKVWLFGTFWNVFFPPNIFNLQLVEPAGTEPPDAEGQT